jgi:gas vesicle protein
MDKPKPKINRSKSLPPPSPKKNKQTMKNKIQEALDVIYPMFRKIQMQASNLDMTATNMGYEINWETGKVEKENAKTDDDG